MATTDLLIWSMWICPCWSGCQEQGGPADPQQLGEGGVGHHMDQSWTHRLTEVNFTCLYSLKTRLQLNLPQKRNDIHRSEIPFIYFHGFKPVPIRRLLFGISGSIRVGFLASLAPLEEGFQRLWLRQRRVSSGSGSIRRGFQAALAPLWEGFQQLWIRGVGNLAALAPLGQYSSSSGSVGVGLLAALAPFEVGFLEALAPFGRLMLLYFWVSKFFLNLCWLHQGRVSSGSGSVEVEFLVTLAPLEKGRNLIQKQSYQATSNIEL